MPNTYFQFKRFLIQQDHCAMKVCTDACILGAWFAEKLDSMTRVLDIGSGTGLLMLMLAQKNRAQIHGIELDPAAFSQSNENISGSKWKERLEVFQGDARSYCFPTAYDFIISNPPFYENDLRSPLKEKNIAKHGLELSLEDLLYSIDGNLTPLGSFGILLPFHRNAYFENLANSLGFYTKEKLFIRQKPGQVFFRSVLQFCRQKPQIILQSELNIQQERSGYCTEFSDLLKDYYLHL